MPAAGDDGRAGAERPSPSTYIRLAAVLVGLLTLLVFLSTLRNGFVNWDDERNFTVNTRYRGLGPAQLAWMFTTFHMGPYQPLSWLTLGLDYTLWGMNPVGYHLTNVLLHTANAVLLFVLILRLFGHAVGPATSSTDARRALGAAVGALVWALHPLRVESVAWVTERRDLLSGLFLLLALLAYVERPAGPRRSVVGFAALALLAKANTMILPGLLLVLDVYPLRRLGGRAGWTSATARRVLLEKAPLVALSVVAGVVALVGQERVGALIPLTVMSPGARLGTAMYQVGFYLWKTMLPIGLQPVYEYLDGMGPLHPLALAGAATLGALIGAGWGLRRRFPAVAAAVAVYLLTFAPTNGIVQAGPQVAADRYTYLPALAWSPLVAAAVVRISAARAAVRVPLTVLAALTCSLLALLTAHQVSFWRDSVTLWEHALTCAPHSALVHQWLARAYLEFGRDDDMVQLYERWLENDPLNADGWADYGVLLANKGADDRARPVLERAIELDTSNSAAHFGRALIRDRSGDSAGALADYDEVLRLNPERATAYYNRALVRHKTGDRQGALEDVAKALTFDDIRSDASAYLIYFKYGRLLLENGQAEAGLRAFETSASVAPAESRAQIEGLLRQLEAQKQGG